MPVSPVNDEEPGRHERLFLCLKFISLSVLLGNHYDVAMANMLRKQMSV